MKQVNDGLMPLASSLQALVITTAGWTDRTALCQRFERDKTTGTWRTMGDTLAAVTGRNGLAWGRGLHVTGPSQNAPVKKEGDGKAPAGVFTLPSAFGTMDGTWTSLKIDYTLSTPSQVCVDDTDSPFYNRIVDTTACPVSWKSDETMVRDDGQYSLGVVVGHNMGPSEPGSGSCIFLHVWKGPEHGTSGCTAFSLPDLEEIVRWLDASKRPVLIQLPQSEYDRLKIPWDLP